MMLPRTLRSTLRLRHTRCVLCLTVLFQLSSSGARNLYILACFSQSWTSTTWLIISAAPEALNAPWRRTSQVKVSDNCAKCTLVMQLADLLDDQAQEISENTPEMTENLQQKAEEQAGKVSEKAKPAADQASSAIEGGAKRVAEGGLHTLLCTLQPILMKALIHAFNQVSIFYHGQPASRVDVSYWQGFFCSSHPASSLWAKKSLLSSLKRWLRLLSSVWLRVQRRQSTRTSCPARRRSRRRRPLTRQSPWPRMPPSR